MTTNEANATVNIPYTSTMMVNLADDAEIRLVSALTETDPTLQESCTQLTTIPDQLLKMLISSATAMDALMTQLDSEEALGSLSVLSVLLGKTDPSFGLLHDLATKIVNTGNDIHRKVSFISILFNSTHDTSSKCFLFTTLLDLAAAVPTSSSPPTTYYFRKEEALGRIIYPSNNNTEPQLFGIIQNWTTKQRCQVYDAVCRVLALPIEKEDQDEQVTCRQRYLLKYISEDPSNITVAKQVSIGAIRDPISLFQLQQNLLSTVRMVLTQSDPNLYELLKIVQQGNLSDYQAFVQKHGSSLADWGLDASECEANMRTLTVCTLANHYEADIPYTEIATAVQQEVSEVESTVIQAIRTGLLQAKMDQLHQTVMVERSVVRKFDMDQWKKLHGRLMTWKTNVGGILDTLKQQQQQTAKAPGQ